MRLPRSCLFLMRSIGLQELQGFQDALLELCLRMDFSGLDTIDIVGTGGDGKNTLSLRCPFIVAGAGHKVSKTATMALCSGSSNVIESLGYKFKNDNAALRAELEEANICFLHADVPSGFKNVGPIRKNLGMRTFSICWAR